MPRYMLDSNIVSFSMRERPPAVLERIAAAAAAELVISVITLAELRAGAALSDARDRYDGLTDTFVRAVEVLPFDADAAAAYAEVRSDLQRRGQGIGGLDLLIAGHAIATGSVLVTNNRREFDRVTGLRVEDWSA